MTADVIRARRNLGAVAVATSVVVWWPAFTLGAWGQVFFEQILTLWAAATAALVMVLLREGAQPIRRPLLASLALPFVWIALSFLPTELGTLADSLIEWFGIAVTVVGLPAMVWVILQTARPDILGAVSVRTRIAAAGAVVVVAAFAFTLGRLNPYFMTCDDFLISGESAPPGCTTDSP